ncbi:glutathione-dependent formaldehyde dehydrogenase [Modestobacter muralis]|uniref:Glutathione-dependent formaldehyde dehydrogenase n=1 Tax=Modestobacter muralis TaxID=1608614 RepID=A0A6P0H7S7_9ACTN|nr:zinc-dependent alcohol dehydrogenase [Modestobacter muralis]NEK95040.1 glutathione-dependent formaldehyde dehydrogenase [Modestobacter muralis]NEN51928.1 glutathione-dependent formaldehyde dehydrogenase [Modestobacter muralis]
MKAVTWHGTADVRVEEVPDPFVQEPTDAVIRVTTTNICGSDLHLYDPLSPFMGKGDVLGHEAMGQVVEVGSQAGDLKVGDRVSIPFQISCGHCWMCQRQLYTQCETTQVRDQGMGAALFGFSKLYGEVPGGQAEYLRVPQAQFTHVKLPEGPPDDRFAYLSDILPTAWQGVEYAAVPEGGTLVVLGLGPIGDFACRIAEHKGFRVIGVDLVTERLMRARLRGIEVVDLREHESGLGDAIRDMTDGRGPDSVLDAVGMEAHGSPLAGFVQKAAGLLPKALSAPVMKEAGVDRLSALYSAIDIVRRGGTISVSGVYAGAADPMPLSVMFDKQVQLRMGQANIKKWVPEIMPLLGDDDPLGVDSFATHRLPLSEAPDAYAKFQQKADGYVKVQLKPEL